METNYYFSPTAPNLPIKDVKELINKNKEEIYSFCTPWQTNNSEAKKNESKI